MRPFLLLLSCMVILQTCAPKYNIVSSAAQLQYPERYLAQLEPGSDLLYSRYNYTFEKTRDGKYIFKQYRPETKQKTHEFYFDDLERTTKVGQAREWYDNGFPYSEGQYQNDKQEGQWTLFSHISGLPRAQGVFEDGLREGTWIQFDDSTGIKTAEFNYKQGKLEGPFMRYEEEELAQEGRYQAGELIWDTLYIASFSKGVEVHPYLASCQHIAEEERKQCSDNALLKAIYSNIQYPDFARENDIQGQALITFVVEPDGAINQYKVLRGVCDAIEEEVLRIESYLPDWVPGRVNDKSVAIRFILPVKFKLE